MSLLHEVPTWFASSTLPSSVVAQVVKATLLLLLAWALSAALRRASASARHVMWLAALLAVFALPLLSGILPTWRLSVIPMPTAVAGPATVDVARRDARPARVVTPSIEPAATVASAPVPIRTGGARWPDVLFSIWVIGAIAFLMRLLASTLSAWRLARQATPVTDKTLLADVSSVREALGFHADVTVVESPRVSMPMAWGVFRRVVLLPVAAREWSEARRRVVLLHEVAHLKRRDCETLMLARVVAAVHWFNPLVWIAVRKIQAEREHACDDLVLATGTPGTDYAHHLLDIARGMRSSFVQGWAMVAMARPSELEGRLLAILDPSLDRARRTRAMHTVGVVSIALLALPLAAVQPGTGVEEEGRPPETSPPETLTSASISTMSDSVAEASPPRFRGEEDRGRSEGSTQTNPPLNRDARLVEAFTDALRDADGESRRQAVRAGGMLGDADAIPALGRVLQQDQSEHVRGQAAWALGMIEEPTAVPALRGALKDGSGAVRQQAAWALGMIESDSAVTELLVVLTDGETAVRDRAAWALGMIESDSAVAGLLIALTDRDAGVRGRAAWALGMIESDSAVVGLLVALTDRETDVRDRAAWALGMIGAESALDSLLDAMNDESEAVRQRALWAVGQIAGS